MCVARRCSMSLLKAERIQTRMAMVDEHIRCENLHDLDGVMATFGMDARYDDEPWGDHRTGRDGVRSYYTELMCGLPATGRRMEFPLCGVYAFDADDRLAGERIYYDRGVVLGQLGLFHEPLR